MIIYAIDDEPDALELLEIAIHDAIPGADVYLFDDPNAAIENAAEDLPEVVFSDIHMPGMTGLEFGKKLKTINTGTNLIFVTGYSEYAAAAIRVHASGYVMKPVTAEAIKEEMENLLFPVDISKEGLYARTFGNFDFLKNGEPVHFKRRKSKELLALLIDREGAEIKNELAATYLFEDTEYDEHTQNQITTIIADLVRSMKEIGADDLVIRGRASIRVDKQKFACDAYDYWEGKPYAMNLFHGEYMEDYSWSEYSKGKFFWKED